MVTIYMIQTVVINILVRFIMFVNIFYIQSMRNTKYHLSLLIFLLFIIYSCYKKKKKLKVNDFTWTYTYLKAKNNRKEELKLAILKNWFVVDSIAKKKGLINNFELIKNISQKDSTNWDFIVAVEYFTEENYADISEEFEDIRNSHKNVNINGMVFAEIGEIVGFKLIKKEN